jgi:hypothetical protein
MYLGDISAHVGVQVEVSTFMLFVRQNEPSLLKSHLT